MKYKTMGILNARDEIIKKLTEVRDAIKNVDNRFECSVYNEELTKNDNLLKKSKPVEIMYNYYLVVREALLDFENIEWTTNEEGVNPNSEDDELSVLQVWHDPNTDDVYRQLSDGTIEVASPVLSKFEPATMTLNEWVELQKIIIPARHY